MSPCFRRSLWLLLLTGFLVCRAGPARASLTVRDALGRTVALPGSPARIVSLAPSITETLYALGAGDRIVGVTDFCNFPPDAKRKPKVGGVIPNLEAIVAVHPDLAIAVATAQSVSLAERLADLHVPILFVQSRSLTDIYQSLDLIGRATGKNREAVRLAENIRSKLSEVRTKTDGLRRRKVLYLVNLDPPLGVGRDSYLNDLLEAAGAENITGDLPGDYPRISDEAIVGRSPDLILVSEEGTESFSEVKKAVTRRWPMVDAVKNGAVFPTDRDLFNRPGPRIGDLAAGIARMIHPEIAGVDR